ncbi:hypothetical protein [Faecalibaculum rodentium]|uniref:Uncharacterized protein n=1 Tax=Faecalibaculum rodentium TaxID=1702221 RepID=A0A1Q9YIQ5_9FIRM|nr:hypothetical protein [Faecalibaculum rodentium]OLU44190.1 hypothetical protein BO223_09145 [Faecalibaculum rodentium]
MRLFFLEMKRILSSRIAQVLMALALLCSLLLAWLPVTYCYSTFTNAQGQEVTLTGLESVAFEKNLQVAAAGEVTPEKVKAAVEHYQACLRSYGVTESYDLPPGVYEREIMPVSPLLHGVKEAFADPETGMAPSIMEIDPDRLDSWYEICEQRIASLMAMEQPGSQAAQKTAMDMYRSVPKPFQVWPGMNTASLDYQNMLGFLMLLFCVVLAAPSFAAGYQSGADDIFRSTRYGRKQLAIVRIGASMCLSSLWFLGCSVVYLVTANSLFGWECVQTSLQMMYSIVSLPGWSIGQLQVFFAGAATLSVLASVSLTMFVSTRCRSALSALAVSLLLCLLPTVAVMTMPGQLSTWLATLLPAGGTGIQASFLYAVTDFQFLTAGELAIWTPWAMLAAWVLEIPLFAWLAIRAYDRHQPG